MSSLILCVIFGGINLILVSCSQDSVVYVQFTENYVDESCSLPDSLYMTITSSENTYNLTLSISRNIPANVPVYEYTDGVSGSYTHGRLKPLTTRSRHYQDVAYLAAMTVQCYVRDGSVQLEASGTFVTSKGERVSIEREIRHRRSVEPAETPNTYRLVKEGLRSGAYRYDYNLPPLSEKDDTHIKKPRRKRQLSEEIYIDVLVLIENRLYMLWYNKSDQTDDRLRREDTLTRIRQYYAFVLNGIDVRYKRYSTRMNIRLIGYLIESNGEREWIRRVRVNETSSYQDLFRLNGDRIQDSLLQLKQTNIDLPPHDHLMVFTGYDMYYEQDGTRGNLLGIAFFAVVCYRPDFSLSVIEDTKGLVLTIDTATHELAHGFGVDHDGDNNQCRSEDLFIMSDGVGYPSTENNAYNIFLFSPCSTVQLTQYITDRLDDRNGSRSCMTQMIPATNVTDLTGRQPGQVYTADEQCRMIEGTNSSFCSDVYGGNFTSICRQMLCLVAPGMCSGNYAAEGTFCGQDKWCSYGKCVNVSTVSECDTCVSSSPPSSLTPLQTNTPRHSSLLPSSSTGTSLIPRTSSSTSSHSVSLLSSKSVTATSTLSTSTPTPSTPSSTPITTLTSLPSSSSTSASATPTSSSSLSSTSSPVSSSTSASATPTSSPSLSPASKPSSSSTSASSSPSSSPVTSRLPSSTSTISTYTYSSPISKFTSSLLNSSVLSTVSFSSTLTSPGASSILTSTPKSSASPKITVLSTKPSAASSSTLPDGVTVSPGSVKPNTPSKVTEGPDVKTSSIGMVTKDSETKTPITVKSAGGLSSSDIGIIAGGSVGGLVVVIVVVIVVYVIYKRQTKAPAPPQNGYHMETRIISSNDVTKTMNGFDNESCLYQTI